MCRHSYASSCRKFSLYGFSVFEGSRLNIVMIIHLYTFAISGMCFLALLQLLGYIRYCSLAFSLNLTLKSWLALFSKCSCLQKYMPNLAGLFSHVLVDVSSVRSLCIRWYPRGNIMLCLSGSFCVQHTSGVKYFIEMIHCHILVFGLSVWAYA